MTTIDDDRLMTVRELTDAFGLGDNVWRTAIHEGRLPASLHKGPIGFMVRAGDARVFVKKLHSERTTAKGTA